MIGHDLAPFLPGRDGGEVEALDEAMLWHIHYVGRGGIAAFAVSALDIALWNLRGRRVASRCGGWRAVPPTAAGFIAAASTWASRY